MYQSAETTSEVFFPSNQCAHTFPGARPDALGQRRVRG
jgi:hypothetical protein